MEKAIFWLLFIPFFLSLYFLHFCLCSRQLASLGLRVFGDGLARLATYSSYFPSFYPFFSSNWPSRVWRRARRVVGDVASLATVARRHMAKRHHVRFACQRPRVRIPVRPFFIVAKLAMARREFGDEKTWYQKCKKLDIQAVANLARRPSPTWRARLIREPPWL